MTFEEKMIHAQTSQVDKYNDIVLNIGVDYKNLTDNEKSFILWIAGWDQYTADNFISVMTKARGIK